MNSSVSGLALLILISSGAAAQQLSADTLRLSASNAIADTVPTRASDAARPVADSLLRMSIDSIPKAGNSPDTTQRRKAIVYSDAYGTRATIHRRLSYSMLPLFALSYFTGDQLFKNGPAASSLVKNLHRGSATAVSVLFAVNTVTGGLNLWEGRHDPTERKRKILHSVLFAAASGGFAYAGAVLANQAETSLIKRRDHRTVNFVSMGVSAASVLVMMVGRD